MKNDFLKKQLRNLLLVILTIPVAGSYAQETRFFMPAEIQKAYKNQTRSYDGKPGKNYWQNTVDYSINVKIIPSEFLIEGWEEVVFHNNSPDKINTLVVRLYGDVLRKGNARDNNVKIENLTDGVDIENITINDTEFDLNKQDKIRRSGTNLYLTLNKPSEPGSETVLKVSWKQKIPLFSNPRTAAYDKSTFFIAYWYPQIAVYDDIFGWDNLNYTFRTEFYNNLGNFDVKIEVPDNYIVWATGELQNSERILSVEMHKKYLEAKSSSETIHIISPGDLENGIKTLSNIWHYKATEVTDVAIALSDHYLWDAAVEDINGRKVLISSAYPLKLADICSDLVSIQKKAMKHFSEDIPGISYPYESFTTFISRGMFGMEFPMMANNGQPDMPLAVHEMFHTYFPMYVRTNERRWAWMDEGWAVYNELLLVNRYFGNNSDIRSNFPSGTRGFARMGTISDLPLMTSTQFMSDENTTFCSYQMPAMVNAILHHHLGEDLFIKGYREYIKRWAKKSPTPYDYFYTFEDVSGQDLSWLWKPWFFEFGVTDISIGTFEKDKLTIIQKGNKPVPVFAEFRYKNGDTKRIDKSAVIWKDGKKEIEMSVPDYENIAVILVNTNMADFNIWDNVYPSLSSIYKNIDVPTEITGPYQAERLYFGLNIEWKDEVLWLIIPGLEVSMVICPEDKTHFRSLDGSTEIIFTFNESGHTEYFTCVMNGYKINCTKIH